MENKTISIEEYAKMQATIKKLQEENEQYLHIIKKYVKANIINAEHKDRLFKFIFGKNKKLLDACKPLYEYSWLIDRIRIHQKNGNNLNTAVDKAVTEMPNNFIIKPLIIANRAEVKNMLIFEEFNEEKYKNLFIEEGREKGREEGRIEGRNERNKEVAADLLREGNMSAAVIAKISKLSEDTVRKLANSLGIIVL